MLTEVVWVAAARAVVEMVAVVRVVVVREVTRAGTARAVARRVVAVRYGWVGRPVSRARRGARAQPARRAACKALGAKLTWLGPNLPVQEKSVESHAAWVMSLEHLIVYRGWRA